jgi:putative PIN family toxin of toxin-antitoxin system
VRVVLDANVLISALLSRTGAPVRLLELWLDGAFELVICDALLDEVERTLARPKLRERIEPEDAVRFIEILQQFAEAVEDPRGAPPVRSADPDDDYLLALAARERAQLVSGDEHVLALATALPISAPREFLDELQRDTRRRS